MENKKLIYSVLAVCIAILVGILCMVIFGKGGEEKGDNAESQTVEESYENAGPAVEDNGAEAGDIEINIDDLF